MHLYMPTLFVLTGSKAMAQLNVDSLLLEVEANQHEVFNLHTYTLTNKKEKLASKKAKVFESQGLYHSTYLILNDDSTYVYYSVYEIGFDVTVGNWSQYKSDTLRLNWNKEKTFKYINNKKKYKRYFQYGTPLFTPMTNWLVKKYSDKLEPIITTSQ